MAAGRRDRRGCRSPRERVALSWLNTRSGGIACNSRFVTGPEEIPTDRVGGRPDEGRADGAKAVHGRAGLSGAEGARGNVGAERSMVRYRSRRLPDTVLTCVSRPAAVRPAAARGRAVRHQQHPPAVSGGRACRAQALVPVKACGFACRPSGSQVERAESLDFVSNQFANGRRFRVLNIVDVATRVSILFGARL